MDIHESDRSSKNPRPPSEGKESHARSESTPNRSISSEKKRYVTLPSPWGLPTAAAHGMGAVAKKVISNRFTDSLWSSKRSSSSGHVPSDSSSIADAKRENISNESHSDHTFKPSLIVADEQTAKLPVSSKPTHEREKTHLKGKNVIIQSENSRPSHVRPINQHHRPRITSVNVINRLKNLKPSDGSHVSTADSNVIDQSENSKPPDGSDVNPIGSNVIDKSENLKPPDGLHVSTPDSNVIDQSENSKPLNDSHVRLVNQHRWPSTTDSNVIGHSKPPDGSHVRPVNQHRWSDATRYNVTDQTENSKPPDGSHGRLVNQHRWPGTIGSNVLNKNVNPSNEAMKTCITSDTGVRAPNHGKMLPNYASKPLQESSSDATNISSSLVDDDRSKVDKSERISTSIADDGRLEVDKLQRMSNLVLSSSHKTPSVIPAELQPSSPKKTYGLASRGVSPSRTGVNPSHASRGASLAPSKGGVRGVSLTPATREVTLTRPSRGVSLTPAMKMVNPSPTTKEMDPFLTSRAVDLSFATKEVNPSIMTRGVGPFPTTKGVSPSRTTREFDTTPSVRGTSPMPPERGASATPTAKSVSPPPDNHTPIRSSSPRQSDNSNTVSNSIEMSPSPAKEISLAPTRGVSPAPLREISHTLPTRGVSPTPLVRGVSPSPSGRENVPSYTARGVNATSTRPSSPRQSCDSNTVPYFTEVDHSSSSRGGSSRSRRSAASRLFFNSSIISMFTKYSDSKKEKNKEDARHLDLLRNIQVQWQFVNASAEAALDLQRVTAEKSLFDMWRTILELWDSVAAMKTEINQLILQLKLYAILYRQMVYIDEWGSIERDYGSAVSVTTEDLHARTLRLPTTEGIKVDVKDLKLVVSSAVQLMQTTALSIESTLSKLDGTPFLASELANIASHERFLLDECEIFLASAAPLQIEECSLRSLIIQSKRE